MKDMLINVNENLKIKNLIFVVLVYCFSDSANEQNSKGVSCKGVKTISHISVVLKEKYKYNGYNI